MLLFHHFNVFGYNSKSIVVFICFHCYLSSAVIFLIYLFVTAKAALPKIVLKKASRFRRRNVKSINKLIGTSVYEVVMNTCPDERNASVIFTKIYDRQMNKKKQCLPDEMIAKWCGKLANFKKIKHTLLIDIYYKHCVIFCFT